MQRKLNKFATDFAKSAAPTSTSETKYRGGRDYQASRGDQRARANKGKAQGKTAGSRRWMTDTNERAAREVVTRRARKESVVSSALEPWVSEREKRLADALQYLARRENGQPGLVQSMSRGIKVVEKPNLEALFCSPTDAYGGWSDDAKVKLATENYAATWGTTPPVGFADAVAQRDPCLPRHVDELVRAFPPYTGDDIAARDRIAFVQRDAQQLLSGTYKSEMTVDDAFRKASGDASIFGVKIGGDEPATSRVEIQARFAQAGPAMRRRVEALAAGTVYDPNAPQASNAGGVSILALLALAYFGGLFK